MSLDIYVPGRAIENDPRIATWAKLGSNENCLGPSPRVQKAINDHVHLSHRYPNAKRLLVVDTICEHFKSWGVKKNQVALGNGSSELIVNLVRTLVGRDEALLYCWPAFVMYPLAANAHERQRIAVPLKADMSYNVPLLIETINDRSTHTVKLVFLANPNNPTGTYLNQQQLKEVMENISEDVVIVLDEAYCEYVFQDDYPNGLFYALSRPRTLVLRTFSKIYGLAGLRLGYAIGDARIIDLLCRIMDPFNVNSLVQHAAIAALMDQEHVATSLHHNLENRPVLAEGLRGFGFTVCDSVGNFVMAKRSPMMPSIADICDGLFGEGVITRPLFSFGLNEWLRISVGTKAENAQLFASLASILVPKESLVAG
jgi:histidinol-phosphate aminotransferase